jgi:hypothetical protein
MPGGNAPTEKSRKDVVALLFIIAGEQAVLEQKRDVAEAVLRGGRVRQVRREREDDLGVFGGDEFKALAEAVVVGDVAARYGLARNVESKFFFEARGGRKRGRDPVRLLGLRVRDAIEPGREVVVGKLGLEGARDQEDYRRTGRNGEGTRRCSFSSYIQCIHKRFIWYIDQYDCMRIILDLGDFAQGRTGRRARCLLSVVRVWKRPGQECPRRTMFRR